MYIKSLYRRILSLLWRIPGEIYVFLAALLYRLPTLGYDFINNDAFLWKSRGYAFGSALTSLDFAGTAVIYHPGVTLLWCQFIAMKIYSVLADIGVYKNLTGDGEFLVNNQIQATVVVVLTSALVAIAYSQLKRIIGVKVAVLAILILLMEPFFVALSRTIHTDAIISLFMFVSVLYFYSYISGNGKLLNKDAIWAGAFAGFAFLTKSLALFLIPFFLLITVLFFLRSRNHKDLYKPFIVLSYAVLAFFIFWPAMWVKPVGAINMYLFEGVQGVAIEEGHEHVWFGELTADPGPLFYPIVLAGRYSIFLIIFALASVYFLFKNRKSLFGGNNYGLFSTMALFFVFYLLMVTLASKKLDRYSLPIVFPLSVLAAWSLSEVFTRKVLVIIVSLVLISRIILFVQIHPNYLAYYSLLVGGLDKGRYVIEPKWLVGYDEVAKYFNQLQEEEGRTIKVAIADYDYLRPFANFEVLNIKHEAERNEAEYFVLPVYRQERNTFYITSHKVERIGDTIDVGGVEYYHIYKVIQ